VFTLLAEIAYILRDLAFALVGMLFGHRRRRTQHTVDIRAPRDAVWQAITPKSSTTTDSLVPMSTTLEAVPGTEDVFRTIITFGKGDTRKQSVVTWRETLRRERESLHYQILAESTDPALIQGTDEYTGSELADIPDGTRLTIFRESTPRHFLDAVLAPMDVRNGARSLRKQLHDASGATSTAFEHLNGFAVTISLLAIASFWYLAGLQAALITSLLIILHELGHAAAMQIVGIGVKRILLVPFFGGLAVPKIPYRTDFQLGFVCLMGPGFSLIPTFAFFAAYLAFGGELLWEAATISAVLNGFNLLPIVPLDGGHVMKSILTAVGRRIADTIAWVGVAFGLLGLWWLKDESNVVVSAALAMFFLLGVAGLYFTSRSKDALTTPMSRAAAAALLAGFIVTAAGYGLVAYALIKHEQSIRMTEAPRADRPERPFGAAPLANHS
jgi:Zn-dependent protease